MNVSEKITINSPAENVWKTLSTLDGVEKYLPVVKSSKIRICIECGSTQVLQNQKIILCKDCGDVKRCTEK